ncbi:MAG: histidine kinase [Desulfuromonadaceae bacterium GWC2_58_13]|nr:MAG: histidine kinase [Desulfuromonadaceae bacterium GWC2_58_13]
MKSNILLVDDEVSVLKALQRSLIDEDLDVYVAECAAEGLKLIEQHKFKVVVSDERMPDMCGSEFLSIISLQHPEVVRITLTGQASIEAAMTAVNQGEIYRFLLKPWNDTELTLAIRSAIEKYDLEMKNRKLLSLIRNQALKLEQIEKKHPGLTNIDRGEDGSFMLKELNDDEVAKIMKECRVEIPKEE